MPGTSGNDIELLVTQYLPKIKYYANKFSLNLPPELSEDDLVSAGVVGLLEAISRYDCKREASLKTFSDYRIKGAIIDEIRSMQWTSRDARKKLSVVRETYKSMEVKLSRTPFDKEVADELGISTNKLHRVLLTSNMNVPHSIYDVVKDKYGEPVELIDFLSDDKESDPYELLELKEARGRLAILIEDLPQREKLILKLYYYAELTLKEIGILVGLTESRVCQLISNVIMQLREDKEPAVKSFRDT